MSLFFYNFSILLYSTAIRLASLWNPKARLWVAGRRNFPSFSKAEKTIWMHCASLGEFEQGRPVLEAMRKNFPGYRIVLSFFSPSGYEIRKNYSGADHIIYLPVDTSANAKKLVESINPSIVFWVKYEYWFHYLTELKDRRIPIVLVSGIFRPSQPFFKWYGGIWKKMLGCFDNIFVQDENSLQLLQQIDVAVNAVIGGDTRFDRVIAIAEKKESIGLVEKFINGDKTLVAGSTWEDDEIELTHYVKLHPEIKFIIAPHEIGETNLKDVKKAFANSIFYSELEKNEKVNATVHVLIIDNIGMLSSIYQYATVTYIGGGFGSDGIHNTLEAAVYAKPVVFGPEYEKFAEAHGLVAAGAAFSINNALELEKLLDDFFTDDQLLLKAGKAAGDFVYRKQGATGKIIDYVNEKRLLTN